MYFQGKKSVEKIVVYFYCKLGVIHKLREQGEGEGGVSEMFTFVHKGGGESFANVHVAFLRVIFQHFLHNIFSQ